MSTDEIIYFDNQATTAVDPRVLEAMLPYLREAYGNASSKTHALGWRAEEAVARGREQVAALIGAQAKEIVFTSGATEANNLAIIGLARKERESGGPRRHIVTALSEHKAVLDACRALEHEGFEVTYLHPQPDGRVLPEMVEGALREDTLLVTLMTANNEVGVVHPIAELTALCAARDVYFHTDAVQGAGKVAFDVEGWGVPLASLTAHKLYGPKGVGALYVRRRPRVPLAPLLYGGGQERGYRPGTLNVPGIVGFGMACELARLELDEERARLRSLRDRFLAAVRAGVDGVTVHGSLEHRIPGNLSLAFDGVEAEALLLRLGRRVALSAGSACSSATLEPSHVLKALGVPHDVAHRTVRVGLGRFNTEAEVDEVSALFITEVKALRESNV